MTTQVKACRDFGKREQKGDRRIWDPAGISLRREHSREKNLASPSVVPRPVPPAESQAPCGTYSQNLHCNMISTLLMCTLRSEKYQCGGQPWEGKRDPDGAQSLMIF